MPFEGLKKFTCTYLSTLQKPLCMELQFCGLRRKRDVLSSGLESNSKEKTRCL